MNEINWKEIIGCMGFFNLNNGIFEVIKNTRIIKASDNQSPTFMVVDDKGEYLWISADGGFTISEVKKKYTEIINPL